MTAKESCSKSFKDQGERTTRLGKSLALDISSTLDNETMRRKDGNLNIGHLRLVAERPLSPRSKKATAEAQDGRARFVLRVTCVHYGLGA